MPDGPIPYYLGDVVRLRKPHPCGGREWTVVRLGADIGLRCLGCQHKVLLTRRDLGRRLKMFVSRGPEWPGESSPETDPVPADPPPAVPSPAAPNPPTAPGTVEVVGR